jgi:hypothetical protein
MGPTSALLSRPGRSEVEELALSGQLQRFDFLEPAWSVWRGRAVDDASRVLVATVRAETCLDTMADLPPFDYPPAAYSGCGRRLRGRVSPAPDR